MARDDERDDRSDSGTGRWFALGGGILALAVVGGVWVALTGHDSNERAGSGATTTVTAPATGTATKTGPVAGSPATSTGTTSAATNGCGFTDGWSETDAATSAPSVTWDQVSSMAAPTSKQFGPRKASGPDNAVRTCYQHSPTGAVLAAINIAVGGSDPKASDAVVNAQFTNGPGKQEALSQEAQAGSATVAGYQVQACNAAGGCLISVAFSAQGSYVEAVMPMVWRGGDWKVNGNVTGLSDSGALNNLDGFVALSPAGGGRS